MAFNRFNPPSKSSRGSPAKSPTGLSSGVKGFVEAEKLMQIAFVLPASVLIGWIGGWWLGHLLHQKWIEIAGVVFGCVSGLVFVIQMAVQAEKKTASEDEAGNEAGKGTPHSKS